MLFRSADPTDDDARVPFLRSPDNLVMPVTGGWGSGAGFSALCPGWGGLGGYASSRRVEFPQ